MQMAEESTRSSYHCGESHRGQPDCRAATCARSLRTQRPRSCGRAHRGGDQDAGRGADAGCLSGRAARFRRKSLAGCASKTELDWPIGADRQVALCWTVYRATRPNTSSRVSTGSTRSIPTIWPWRSAFRRFDMMSCQLAWCRSTCRERRARPALRPHQVRPLLEQLHGVPGLRLCGLMTIAPAEATDQQAQRVFRALHDLRANLQAEGFVEMKELSMGMSNDFQAAVAEGATLVRIGRRLCAGAADDPAGRSDE